MDGRSLQLLKFHDGTITTSDGEEYGLQEGSQTMKLEIKSVGTATLKFESMGTLGVWRPLLGSKDVADVTLVTETSDLEPWYQFDVTGASRVRVKITANSGSPVFVYGKIVG